MSVKKDTGLFFIFTLFIRTTLKYQSYKKSLNTKCLEKIEFENILLMYISLRLEILKFDLKLRFFQKGNYTAYVFVF